LIGRPFDDPTVTQDAKSWPFKVVNSDGNPKIEVEYLGETKQFTPQEISSMVLIKVCAPNLQFSYRLFDNHFETIDEGGC
jgi:molecular chaperone DnaK (HSP70)